MALQARLAKGGRKKVSFGANKNPKAVLGHTFWFLFVTR